ncbi:hypothetical protein [Marinobacterium sp. BA1]|uniref:hypothetical protein n=1 Tax=Marinobacterium sp. BA1 TaxID=3138931 RepID=UPI0032E59D90
MSEPTKIVLQEPRSVVQVAASTGLLNDPSYVNDEEGFTAAVMESWLNRPNNHFGNDSIHHLYAAQDLYLLYISWQAAKSKGITEHPDVKQANILHLLYRTGSVEQAAEQLKVCVQSAHDRINSLSCRDQRLDVLNNFHALGITSKGIAVKDIKSVRSLSNGNGTITLTPILYGQSYPVFVDITRREFDAIGHSEHLTALEAVKRINEAVYGIPRQGAAAIHTNSTDTPCLYGSEGQLLATLSDVKPHEAEALGFSPDEYPVRVALVEGPGQGVVLYARSSDDIHEDAALVEALSESNRVPDAHQHFRNKEVAKHCVRAIGVSDDNAEGPRTVFYCSAAGATTLYSLPEDQFTTVFGPLTTQENNMGLFAELQASGITSEMLDDLVHDAADRMGSFANNEGAQAQSELMSKASGAEPNAEDIDDEAVSDAASRIASRVNNEGMKEQLLFLEQAGFSDDEVRDWLVEEGHLQGGHDPLSNVSTSPSPSL